MLVTVAICTWNRADLLDQTLCRMNALRIPPGVEWELLVVNNNCTDDTDAVIARHAATLPIRRLLETQQGHSHARNRAVEAARGELILWTDDDVLVDEHWLAEYVGAAERWPQVGYFGGPIEPWYEKNPPPWLDEKLPRLHGMILIRDLASQECALDPKNQPYRQPYGANIAMRRLVFENRCFDPRLGRQGNDPILGEEADFLRQLCEAGITGRWIPTAKVRHFVPAQRTTLKYLWNYFRGYGRTQVRINGPPPGRLLWGAPRSLYRKYWNLLLKAYAQRLCGQREWITPYILAAELSGKIYECRQLHLAHTQ